MSPIPAKPHVVPLSRFVPPDVKTSEVMLQFPPDVLSARMLFVMVSSSPGDMMPPPRLALLLAIVTFFRMADSRL